MNKMLKIIVCASLGSLCFTANAAWQCTVVNPVKNQTWIGVGTTRAVAMQNAIGFCSKNSVNVRNCNVMGCVRR